MSDDAARITEEIRTEISRYARPAARLLEESKRGLPTGVTLDLLVEAVAHLEERVWNMEVKDAPRLA